MKFMTILKRFIPKTIARPLGRWNMETCKNQLNHKIDLSNEDHCGPCGQYRKIKRKDQR